MEIHSIAFRLTITFLAIGCDDQSPTSGVTGPETTAAISEKDEPWEKRTTVSMYRETKDRYFRIDRPFLEVDPNEVVRLYWGSLEFSKTNLEKLSTLVKLRELRMPSRTTDKEIAYIAPLDSLRKLHFDATNVSRAGLLRLPEMKSVELVSLHDVNAKNDVLEGLVRFPNLRSLTIGGRNLTDDGLNYLSRHPKLRHLYLNETGIGDRGVEELRKIPNLDYVSLFGTQCTDGCIDSLALIPKLKQVAVGQSKITAEGIRKLRSLTPNLGIDNGD